MIFYSIVKGHQESNYYVSEKSPGSQRDRERRRYFGPGKDLTDNDRDLYDEDSRIAE
jgi:hypothetical protein